MDHSERLSMIVGAKDTPPERSSAVVGVNGTPPMSSYSSVSEYESSSRGGQRFGSFSWASCRVGARAA